MKKLLALLCLYASTAWAAPLGGTISTTEYPTAYKLGIPAWLQFTGTGSEGTTSPCGAITTAVPASGEHHCSSLTISGAGQLDVDSAVGWLVMRVTGACSIASTATCLGAANTAVANCAISGTGADNGVNRAEGSLGGSAGGGGGAETANTGSVGEAVNASVLGLETTGGAGGAVAGNGAVGTQPGATKRLAFLAVPSLAPLDPVNDWFGGARGGSGGAGTDAGGVGGKGGALVVLVCGSFTTTTGQIVVEGQRGANGTNNITDSGGGGGGGAGAAFVVGDSAYPAANIDCVGGNGGTEGGAPAGNGAKGGDGTCWICETTAGTCAEDLT